MPEQPASSPGHFQLFIQCCMQNSGNNNKLGVYAGSRLYWTVMHYKSVLKKCPTGIYLCDDISGYTDSLRLTWVHSSLSGACPGVGDCSARRVQYYRNAVIVSSIT